MLHMHAQLSDRAAAHGIGHLQIGLPQAVGTPLGLITHHSAMLSKQAACTDREP